MAETIIYIRGGNYVGAVSYCENVRLVIVDFDNGEDEAWIDDQVLQDQNEVSDLLRRIDRITPLATAPDADAAAQDREGID